MEVEQQVLSSFATFKAYAFPIGGILLVLYPAMLMVWTILEGHAAAHSAKKEEEFETAETCKTSAIKDSCTEVVKPHSTMTLSGSSYATKDAAISGQRNRNSLVTYAMVSAALVTVSTAVVPCFVSSVFQPQVSQTPMASQVEVSPTVDVTPSQPAEATSVVFGFSAFAVAFAVAKFSFGQRTASWPLARRGQGYSPTARHAMPANAKVGRQISEEWTAQEAPSSPLSLATSASSPPSLWHDVDLYVKTWLDEPTGLLRYVNEMPMGTLRKFEVQPGAPHNVIEEDVKGSAKLAKFGKPVPFNYGCFPQTYRDPKKADELYSAPGDDDPLDVIDLSDQPTQVGTIVRCRALGAVCLIDEGQADWKVLVVNVDSKSPLADAKTIDDVERIAPGRIQACWAWMDELKKGGGKGNAKLHREIHDVDRALKLIKEDHKSWEELVESADSNGMARGHWICTPKENPVVSFTKALKLGWAPACSVPGQLLRVPGLLTGAARVQVLARSTRTFASTRKNSG